ncbi:hypothetical protein EDB83DRAFT_2316172 [Lactarius deliciosus]|nr:hypothetical protein EDB83DRAFT_2316172 [Lactarius deliciosus]
MELSGHNPMQVQQFLQNDIEWCFAHFAHFDFSPVPQGAAPPRGLSGSSTMRRRPWRPPLQIFVSRGSGSMRPTILIPDPAASERGLSNSRATCPRPSWPPLRGLASRGSGSMRPTVLIPDPAASERGLSNSIATRRRPRWPPLRSLASRGSVRDCLRSAIRQRLDRDRHGPTYDTSRPARACALTRIASHSQIPCILANFEHFGLMWTPYPKRLHAIPVYSTQWTVSPQIYLTPLYGRQEQSKFKFPNEVPTTGDG